MNLSKVKLILARWTAEFSSLPRRLKQTVGGILAIGLVVAAVFVGRTIHHHLNQPTPPKRPTEVASQPPKPAAPSNPKPATPKTSSNKSGGSVASNSTKSSTQSSGAGSTNSSSEIPNTGPGNDLAIFAGASAVGAVAHFGLSRRRQNS